MNDNQIFSIVRTPYHLLITILLRENNWLDGNLTILYDSGSNAKSLIDSIHLVKKYYADFQVESFDDSLVIKKINDNIFNLLIINSLKEKLILKYKNQSSNKFIFFVSGLYENQTYIQNKKSVFILVEDGEALYSIFNTWRIKEMLKRLFNLGTNNYKFKIANEIWCQSPERIKHKHKSIVKKLNLADLMQNLNELKVKNLFTIFGLSNELFELILKGNDEKLLMITQCFSEANAISEKCKIDYYKRIAKIYGNNKKLLIKPHPREETDYLSLFPEALIIPKQFPLEILNFIGKLKIEYGVTINSSALNNCNFIEQKNFLGYNDFEELAKYYKKIKKD